MNATVTGGGSRIRRRRSPLQAIVFLLSLILVAAAIIRHSSRSTVAANADQAEPRPVTPRGDLGPEERSTIEMFERCSKSVVYINPLTRVRRSFLDPTGTLVETGTGSGFIWDEQGHVVTNFHVIQSANQARVTLPDNTTYDAELVGILPDKDIAVLRIEAPAEKLVPVSMGASRDLRVGQRVFAIGNPFGLDFTLTTGVVSALERQIQAVNERTIQGVIQTDAAINPGNSGGPLLDSAGRLIGMNTAILSRSGGSAGIGFAVPVDIINRVVPQLIAHGKIIRPGLGIVPASDAVSYRLRLGGVLILDVAENSAAAQAGLRPTTESRNGDIVLGDIITRIGDQPTPDNDTLLNALEKYEIGQTVEVTFSRQGKPMTVSVTLQAV